MKKAVAKRLVLAIVLVAGAGVASCAHPLAPAPAQSTVDVLPYLVGDASLWPRNGNHAQFQIADLGRREVCWTKYGNSRRFECWRWDEQFIYHAVDHALDGDSDDSYMFTDRRWLPRYLPADATAASPWTLDASENQIVWFNAACQVDASRSHAFPYRMRAWIEPRFDAGPDLGRRDTLMFEYEPYDPAAAQPGARERFYLGLGAGWYQWERSGIFSIFNRLGGPVVPMSRQVWCAGANP